MEDQNTYAIEFEDVSFIYGNDKNAIPAIKNIKFKLPIGKTLILAGGSGSGKSTLCNALNGIIPFREVGFLKGEIKIYGKSVWEQSLPELSKTVGLVKQNPDEQLVTFTVRDEISFGLENLNFPKNEIQNRIDNIVKFMNIEHLINRDIGDLSGGEKQIVVICSYLVMNPRILVLDEPFAFLDQKSSTLLVDFLKRLYENNNFDLTTIIVEHRLSKVLDFTDYLLVLNDSGEVALYGTVDELFHKNFNSLKSCNLRIPWIPDLFKSTIYNSSQVLPLTFDEAIDIINHESKENLSQLKNGLLNKYLNHGARHEEENGSLLKLDKISFKYPNIDKLALNNVSLEINEGDFIGLIGHNGCGKTTLLYLLAGLFTPTEGEIYYKGINLMDVDFYEYAERIGFIFQNPENMLFKHTIKDEILYAPKNFGILNKLNEEDVNNLMEMVGNIEENRNPFNLSWGQKRRLNLSSIFVYNPEVILLDEPFIGQDQKTIDNIIDFLQKEHLKGRTIIISSHDYHLLLNHVEKIIELDSGNLIEYEKNIEYFQKYEQLGPITLFNLINEKLNLNNA